MSCFSFGGVGYSYRVWVPAAPAPSSTLAASLPERIAARVTPSPSRPPSSACSLVPRDACPAPASPAPLILLHGFAQSAASWDAVARAFADAGRPVYALDLTGHGASERPADPRAYALDAQADALLTLARTLATKGDKRPAVLGYSMGGRVTLAALARDPHAFSAVILEAAGFGPATQAERDAAAERDASCATRLRADGLEAFMDFWEQLPLFASQRDLPSNVRARLRAGRLANDAEALARTFERAGQHVMPARATTLETLRNLRAGGTPLLYLTGELDAKYRALAAQAVEAGASVRLVPGAGHNAHLEAPAAFVNEAASFLSLERV